MPIRREDKIHKAKPIEIYIAYASVTKFVEEKIDSLLERHFFDQDKVTVKIPRSLATFAQVLSIGQHYKDYGWSHEVTMDVDISNSSPDAVYELILW